MFHHRLIATAALVGALSCTVAAAPASASGAVTPSGALPSLPEVLPAQQGARWLASQLTSSGYIPSTTPGQPDLAATANTVLALASAGVDPTGVHTALAYLGSHVDAYVTVGGKDGPGQLALLILDAHAAGGNPRSFGGTDLVSRLLATERRSGASAGLFGVQSATFDGAYRQGLSLAALAGAGVTSGSQVTAAARWLEKQQCPDGGWTSLITASNPCNGNPAAFAGPDTNSTALAVEGLSAIGVLGSTRAAAAWHFIVNAEDADGGWGYDPNTASTPGTTDPDSTALVVQAILALAQSPSAATLVKGAANPLSTLRSFQLTSGAGSGAFFYPGSTTPNLIATYQAVPAMADVKIPFDLSITTPYLPSGHLGQHYSATLSASGGNRPYAWQVRPGSGSLPSGLSLDGSTGAISGTPTHAGTSSFTIEIHDTKVTTAPMTDNVGWKVLSITVS
jgi:Putative Ig domain